jgi:hypothetical protein
VEEAAESMTRHRPVCRRAFTTVVCLTLCAISSLAQSYPAWFLNQGSLTCESAVVGYANPSYYPDSAIAQAVRNAIVNAGRLRATRVSGGQAFWSTEGGMFWMGSNIREDFDSMLSAERGSWKILDAFTTPGFVAVLYGDSACIVDPSARAIVRVPSKPPLWTETLPNDDRFFYAVGLAPEYYYETSSWQEAEQSARLSLARTVHTRIKSLQKVAGREGQEVREEETHVTLERLQVVARWRDVRQKIFYVLIRMPKTL